MKILFLTHSFYPDTGGIETTSFMLAHDYSKAGHDVRVLTWSVSELENEFPFLVFRNPSAIVIIKEHLWAELIFENNPCLQLSWPSLFYTWPSIIVLHTWLNRVSGSIGWQDYLKRWWIKRKTVVIACSDALREKTYPNAIVIENAFQDKIFKITNLKSRNGKFLFLGRLVSDKGADLAIKAFSLLQTDIHSQGFNSNISLTIVGEGPERKKLKALVSELNMTQHITFTGNLQNENLVNCLNRHQFILVPSIWEEPFGIVALEGMACGCIPIVSDSGGLPDAVGKAGLTFARGDVKSLLACMHLVISDSALVSQLQRAASGHLANHRQDVVSRKYLSMIEKVFYSSKKP